MSSFAAFVRIAALSTPLLLGGATAVAAPAEGATVLAKPGKGSKKGKAKAGKGKGKGNKHVRGLCAQLQCTDQQAEQVTTRLQSLRQQHRDARKGQAALQTALARELAKDKPSKKELARIQKDVERMQTKLADATLDALLDIHAVLDTEQRKTLAGVVERNGLRRVLRAGGSHEHRSAARTQFDTPPSAPPL